MIINSRYELPFLTGTGSRTPIAVALVLDEPGLASYALPLVRALAKADFIRLSKILFVPPTRHSRQFRKWPWLLRIIDRVYGLVQDPRAPVPLPPEIALLPCRDYRHGEAMDDVDVMLCLGGTVPGGQSVARWGTWWLHYGTGPDLDDHPPYLREILSADPRRIVTLKRVTAEQSDCAETLSSLSFSLSPLLSYMSNLAPCLQASWYLPLQKLWELSAWPEKFPRLQSHGAAVIAAPDPSLGRLNGRLTREILKVARNRASRASGGVEWRIGVRRSSMPLHKEREDTQPSFRWLTNRGTGYWADPFLLEHQGEIWVFFEEMDDRLGRGHVSCGRLSDGDELVDVQPVLKTPFHMSYPQLISDGKEIYLLPESALSGRVTLYRAKRFPWEWEEDSVLLDIPCVDTTIFRHERGWWMFTSPMFVRGHAPATWLYCADSLRGPWRYHPAGPVSTDARWARGAGNVFVHESRLIRPSQDCSSSYGRSLSFNEVLDLDGETYLERPLRTVTASIHRGLLGIHTFNRLGELEVVDGLFPKAKG
jgi:hypothetical protein